MGVAESREPEFCGILEAVNGLPKIKDSVMRRTFKIILEPEVGSGGFSVSVPALPGCATEGQTLEECITNAKEAIQLFIEGLKEDGIPLPESDVLLEEIEVAV